MRRGATSSYCCILMRTARLLVVDVPTVEFVRAAVDNAIARAQKSETESDISPLRPKPDFYASARPTPADAMLVVETADSSLDYDRGAKLPCT